MGMYVSLVTVKLSESKTGIFETAGVKDNISTNREPVEFSLQHENLFL
jgi:hypothetical protein